MSLTLVEALGQLDLEEGQVYRCQVKGHWVELRVLGSAEVRDSPDIDEWEIMLHSWVDLPQPSPIACFRGTYGPLPLPDPPVITRDEGES